jgi:hypothetical protein
MPNCHHASYHAFLCRLLCWTRPPSRKPTLQALVLTAESGIAAWRGYIGPGQAITHQSAAQRTWIASSGSGGGQDRFPALSPAPAGDRSGGTELDEAVVMPPERES